MADVQFRIQILSGSRAGQEVVAPGPMIRFGRDPSCEVAFNPMVDDKVSGTHAQVLFMDNGQILLSDLGSSNGTYVGEMKITAPTPIGSGTMITLGEDGPQVMLSLMAAPPPAPEPEPEPPKSNKKKIILIVLIVLGLCGCSGLAYSIFSDDDPEEEAAEKTGEAKTGEAKTAAKTAEPPKEEEKKHAWSNYKAGTVFELKSVNAKYKSTTVMRHSLLKIDDEFATVRNEMLMNGKVLKAQTKEVKVPLKGKKADYEIEVLEEKSADIEVPAGKFSCQYRKVKVTMKIQGKSTTMQSEVWQDDDVPYPYKTISGDNTQEMIKLEKK